MWDEPGFASLPPEALGVRRLRTGAGVIVAAVALLAIEAIVRYAFAVDLSWPPFVMAGAFILVIAGTWWPWARRSWRAWGWRLDDSTFQTRSGVYQKVWKGVPRDRVQFVEVTAGPLQRAAGLATLVVRTAGVRTPSVKVEDLETDVAEHLRAELSPPAEGRPVPDPGAGLGT